MATLKEIKTRIVSVKNTQKVTKAMQMIAAARLRRAQTAAVNARDYAEHLKSLVGRVAQRHGVQHTYLNARETVRSVEFLVLSSDRGLCGGFNENMFRALRKRWLAYEADGITVHFTVIGKKAAEFLGRFDIAPRAAHVDFYQDLDVETLSPVVQEIAERFTVGEVDQVELVFNRFRSILTQDVTFENILPMTVEAGESASGSGIDYIYEPSAEDVIDGLLDRSFVSNILQACLESVASEFAARMTAMDSATRNASDMIDALSMQYNRARQASITKDLLDIVNGAESLKG